MAHRPHWLLLLAACGGGSGGSSPAPAGPAAAASLDQDPAGRIVVAEVDGRPIYDDCVATQAAAHQLDRRAALDECIAFELLAAEAERRGYAADADVLEARQQEAARAFIDREFAPRITSPQDIPADEVAAFYREYKGTLYVHPEWRSSHHILIDLGYKKVPPGSPRDLEARQVIDEIAAALGGRAVTAKEMDQVAAEFRARYAARKLVIKAEDVPGDLRDQLDPAYRAALYQMPGVGALGPPVRSYFGWHVILLTEIEPAIDRSAQEVEDDIRHKIFETRDLIPDRPGRGYRWVAFARWAAGFAHGKAWIDDRWLVRLAKADAARADLAPIGKP